MVNKLNLNNNFSGCSLVISCVALGQHMRPQKGDMKIFFNILVGFAYQKVFTLPLVGRAS